jgi:hypothetical protein
MQRIRLAWRRRDRLCQPTYYPGHYDCAHYCALNRQPSEAAVAIEKTIYCDSHYFRIAMEDTDLAATLVVQEPQDTESKKPPLDECRGTFSLLSGLG